MKFIYVLEDDERIQKDLFETLKNIDPQLYIRFFPSLELFHDWLRIAMQEGPKVLASGGHPFKDDSQEAIIPTGNQELRLIIAKNEFLGTHNMNLIKRARDFLIRKKLCPELNPTALVLTAFDSPDFNIKLAEENIISNVIFKPFDKLILKQHLEFALKGHQHIKSDTISAIQIQSIIEMLKDVTTESLSEIGFTTLNNQEIKIGSFSKYYGEIFKSGDKKSVMAYCKSCKAISPTEFLSEFHFFGIDNEQISQIRRHILQNKAQKTTDLKNTQSRTNNILILEADEPLGQELKAFLEDKFSNTTIFTYTHNSQLISDLAGKDTVHRQNLPTQFDIVIANHDFLEGDKKKSWETLCRFFEDRTSKAGLGKLPTPDLYLTSRRKIPVEDMRELTKWSKDVYFTLFDKTYIYKKLLTQHPTLINKENARLGTLQEHLALKAATPVKITEISEGGLAIKYHRAINIGSFREFILWRPDEIENPEIIGTVNFHEKDKSAGDSFNIHFIFFGMKDYYLKHIRLWLREAYIKNKEKT